MKKFFSYFSPAEYALWGSSVLLIALSFALFDRANYLTLCASLIGATSLIFNAKGNPIGQALTVVFSILYGIISYTFSYYAAFCFILDAFDTANLVPSTISVTTSFLAVYLTFRRSPLYALAYAANDVVLIVLWILATLEDFSYLSVVICFVMFLANDIYGFVNWTRMRRKQAEADAPAAGEASSSGEAVPSGETSRPDAQ